MDAITPLEPIDYLVIGHISCDLTENGLKLGGTASYAALTAKAIGLRVGLVTSWGNEISLSPLEGVRIYNKPAKASTTFENIYTPSGRKQYIHQIAAPIGFDSVPENWKRTPIVHLGPIAGEISPELVSLFPNSLIGVTPQGWFRSWGEDGFITTEVWQEASRVLPHSHVAIISTEDVNENEDVIVGMAEITPVFVVTEGYFGARVYWHGDVRRFNAPQVVEIDATGAGDIFSAAFFIRYRKTKNPWEAARFANQLAAQSVTRSGLNSIPTDIEIKQAISEVL